MPAGYSRVAPKLGDLRRTRRAVKLAAQVARDPSTSTPRQAIEWKHCKAAYRLFDEEDVTFPALTAPHYDRTRRCAAGYWLLSGDTTELEFGIHREIAGLGPTGDGGGRGFFPAFVADGPRRQRGGDENTARRHASL